MSITEAKKFSAAKPTRWTLFLRACVLWQLIRFLIINVRMTLMILKSHGQKINSHQKTIEK